MGTGVILSSFFAALAQLGDPRFRRVVILGLLLAMGLLVGMAVGILFLVSAIAPDSFSLPWIGEISGLSALFGWGAFGLMLGMSVFLMQPVAVAFGGLFLESVAEAVEEKHYPGLGPARQISLAETLRQSLLLIGLMLVTGILLLILGFVAGPFAILAWYLVNGWLLGREYFMLVASRRLPAHEVPQMYSVHSIRIWMAGVLMALPLTIPLVNLLIPVLGTATFTHLYQRMAAKKRS